MQKGKLQLQQEWEVPQSIIEYYKPYRNERRMKTLKKLKTKFEIEEYYEIIDGVGQGAYGFVVAAIDNRTKTNIAIKKIEKAFEHKIFTKRTLRELKICRLLKHENVDSFQIDPQHKFHYASPISGDF
jgi:serine/threonine protein kinase